MYLLNKLLANGTPKLLRFLGEQKVWSFLRNALSFIRGKQCRTYGISVCLVIVLLFGLGVSQAIASEITNRIQAKYGSITTMKSNFSQTLFHKESGSKEVRSGTLLFKKPLLVRWETKTPAPELLLVLQKAIWNVFPDEEVAYKYAVSVVEDSKSIVRVITGQARLDQDFSVEKDGVEAGLDKLHLFPHEPSQTLTEAFLWVDKTGLIQRVRIIDFYGNTNEIVFSNHTFGFQVKDADFTFTPPKAFLIEDRSKEGAGSGNSLLQ